MHILPQDDSDRNLLGLEEGAVSIGVDLDLDAVVLRLHGVGDMLLNPIAAADLAYLLIRSAMRVRRHQFEAE